MIRGIFLDDLLKDMGGRSRRTGYNWRKKGWIKAELFNGRYFVLEAEVERFKRDGFRRETSFFKK